MEVQNREQGGVIGASLVDVLFGWRPARDGAPYADRESGCSRQLLGVVRRNIGGPFIGAWGGPRAQATDQNGAHRFIFLLRDLATLPQVAQFLQRERLRCIRLFVLEPRADAANHEISCHQDHDKQRCDEHESECCVSGLRHMAERNRPRDESRGLLGLFVIDRSLPGDQSAPSAIAPPNN